MDKRKFNRKGINLHFLMTLFVFLTLFLSFGILIIITGVLTRLGLIDPFGAGRNPLLPVLGMMVASIILSTTMAAIGGRRMLRPIREIIAATNKVAEGDFSVRLDVGQVPELVDLNRSFNKMAEELESIETLRSDFVSNFSHEFKTPIVSIRGFAKLLKDKDLPEDEREEYTDIIISETERLTELATNILSLSKLENISILTDKESFALDEQIRRVAALTEPRWKEKAITMSLRLESVMIYSEESLLQQVWLNLFDNAIKFTDQGGHISITLKKENGSAIFVIEDNGRGMDESALLHIFDKFYQADSSHSGVGNGLGLSLAHRTVALCGGAIHVESEAGKGSKFTVTLPLR